ncbi:MAG TPA: hypothetical protein VNV87_04515 [Acidimicrobiales bacterium]|jgi:hypothetical protein|nr:hypothetical protein [Acidimicrobiales bacterium]
MLAVTGADWATLLGPVIAALIVTIPTVLLNRRVVQKVEAVHTEVRTSNGLTIAALADAQEGRRIVHDIPTAERSEHDQAYVDALGELDTARSKASQPESG